MFEKNITQEERYNEMMHEPVQTLIPRLAVPTIISMMVTAIYNTADTFFVSQLGTSASGAVGVVFSLMAIIQSIAFMVGMGSGNTMSRLLGQQKIREAEEYAAICFFTELAAGLVLAVLGLSFTDRLVLLLGATETIAPYAKAYASYILLAAPFMMASFGMNNLLRFEGNSFYGMLGMATGGVLNILLDPVFIFGLGLGISGAAIATGLSQFISFCILLFQSNHSPSCISIRISNFRPSLRRYGTIVHNGLPSLARQGIMSVSTIILNFSAHPYGDAAIAAMSIVTRYCMLINSAVIGFGQGFQPVCGYNYGAGNYKRVVEAYYFCIRIAAIVLSAGAVITFIFAGPIITVFRRDDPQVIAIGTLALRLQAVTLPLLCQIHMSNMLTQTIGYGFRASLVAMLRSGLCFIPMLMILPPVLGLLGIQAAQPASDLLSFCIAWLITRNVLGELKSK